MSGVVSNRWMAVCIKKANIRYFTFLKAKSMNSNVGGRTRAYHCIEKANRFDKKGLIRSLA